LNKIVFPPELTGLTEYLKVGIRTYRAKILVQASFWVGAILVGVFACYYAKLNEVLQFDYTGAFSSHPFLISIVTPVAFLIATAVAKFFAPHAGGSGIPQSLYAAALAKDHPASVIQSGMVSRKTAIVKVISTTLSFLGGASIGGEGPTVQVATAIFAASGTRLKRFFPAMNLQSYIVAGAGAGIASAFNTPIGGVAFALEEVALSEFGELKHLVMLSVIIAGLTTQAILGGNTLYLGNPLLGQSEARFLPWAVAIGILGGIMGSIFARIVTSDRLFKLKINWWKRALACGVIVAGINLLFHGATSGNGYSMTKDLMIKGTEEPLIFPVAKLIATAFSTLSGLGGGILAPSLSIGAWMGASASKILMIANPKTCALLGMVAYLTGAFQIPLTAVVLVMEMTDQHSMILPMMITAVFSFGIAKSMMPVSLYHKLIQRNYSKTTLSD
jgi:H+/Cl- antiporter ClcA